MNTSITPPTITPTRYNMIIVLINIVIASSFVLDTITINIVVVSLPVALCLFSVVSPTTPHHHHITTTHYNLLYDYYSLSMRVFSVRVFLNNVPTTQPTIVVAHHPLRTTCKPIHTHHDPTTTKSNPGHSS